MPVTFNPYAAPQTPLQDLPSSLPPPKGRSFLMQGVIAGLQLGGLASFFIVAIMLFTWGKDSTPLGLLKVVLGVMFFSTLVGTMFGGTIQLLALVFGGSPRENEEHNARQEFDNTGFTPPNMV